MRHDERLAVPLEPQVAEETLGIVVVPHVAHVRRAAPAPRRGHVVEELRNLEALGAVFLENREELVRDLAVVVAVGRVEVEDVDARVDEHLDVAAQHPFVGGAVVAEKRFAPVEHRRVCRIGPERRIGLFKNGGVGRQHL